MLENESPQVACQGDEPLGAEGRNSMSSRRRGSPLLIGVRSEHKLSTDHIPILYRTGEWEHPFPGGAAIQPRSDPCTSKEFHTQLHALQYILHFLSFHL